MIKDWNKVFWDTIFSTYGNLLKMAQKTGYDSIHFEEIISKQIGIKISEGFHLIPFWKIERFKGKYDLKPFDVSFFHENVTLNVGINLITSLICGGTGTAFGNATAQSGVGDDSTEASSADTGLIGTATWVGMDGGYPIYGVSQTMIFKSSFTELIGNQDWKEFSIRNSAAAHINLNRKVQNEGTKPGGQIWVYSTTFTGS